MKKVVIGVDNITKLYRIGVTKERHDSIYDTLWSLIMAPIKRFKKLSSLSKFDRDQSSVIKALDKISFTVQKGEILGIIGKNGAGKSTLLKILARVTSPSQGEFYIDGKSASLLEVGTGFHPELTGRENVYLNGTILGMKKKEIDAVFASIVDFSGVEKFLDTPVKRYSSGMRVRLAFAVAAHLQPEILIIDEVLAVGDAEFQKKCLGKMEEISSQGRTVLFVSHNMGSVQELCNRVIVLGGGEIIYDGSPERAIGVYNGLTEKDSCGGVNRLMIKENSLNQFVSINDCSISNYRGEEVDALEINKESKINFTYSLKESLNSFVVSFRLKRNGIDLSYSLDTDFGLDNYREKGLYENELKIPAYFLKEGKYSVSIYFKNALDGTWYSHYEDLIVFHVIANEINVENKGFYNNRAGVVVFQGSWKCKLIS